MPLRSQQECPSIRLEDRVGMLNADQRRVFDNIKAHLLHQKLHEDKECSCAFKPLHMTPCMRKPGICHRNQLGVRSCHCRILAKFVFSHYGVP